MPKSLVSANGTMEFAKRFFHGSLDLSPISLKRIRGPTYPVGTMAVMNKYGNRSFHIFTRSIRCLYSLAGRLAHSFVRQLARCLLNEPTKTALLNKKKAFPLLSKGEHLVLAALLKKE